MERNSFESLENFENEYADEIESGEIEVEDLLGVQIPENALKCEIYLRKIYGDEFVQDKSEESVEVSGKAVVEKLGEKDLSVNKTLNERLVEIEKDPFNNSLESLLARVK